MRRFSYIFLMALGLAAVSCSKQAPAGDVGNSEVEFAIAVKAGDASFENADKIGIFVGEPISKDNVEARVNGNMLVPVEAINWTQGRTSEVSFTAYYPYKSDAKKIMPYSVPEDQKSGFKAFDLLVANAKSQPTHDAIALRFSHVLSKLVVSIDNRVKGVTVSNVEIADVSLNGTVNLETVTVGAVSSTKKSVKPLSSGGTYQILLLPQIAAPKVRVTMSDGKTYVVEPKSAFSFESGKKYTASVVVTPAPEAASFSYTVTDWTGADDIDYGEPVSQSTKWGVVGLGGDWDNDIPMVRTLAGESLAEGLWEADIDYAYGDCFKLRLNGGWDINYGMNPEWTYYGTGDFSDGYLVQEGIDIVLEGPGSYHLEFTYPSGKFVITSND